LSNKTSKAKRIAPRHCRKGDRSHQTWRDLV